MTARVSVCWPLLVIVMGYGGVTSAQQPYSDFRFPSLDSGHDRSAEESRYPNTYRWRPLESDRPIQPKPAPPRDVQSYPLINDYTDEPFGLPRGTYRRIEERHTITPHEEGYRFRPIDPGEQQRVKERNEEGRRNYTDTLPSRPDAGVGNSPFRIDRTPSAPRFRPDKRLDKGSGKPAGRYEYPSGQYLPQFRPQ